jgi:hypothetical protein
MSYYQKTLEQRNKAQIQKRSFDYLAGLPFYIWDEQRHRRKYSETKKRYGKSRCCFNHAIPAGLPKKNGVSYPLFDYEKEVIDAFEQPPHGRVYILKSSSLGITELICRYCLYLACSKGNGHELAGQNIIILTGSRWDLSIDIIRRMRHMLEGLDGFDTRETVLEVQGCRIEAIPSHSLHMRALRGLTNIAFLVADELAFFSDNLQDDVRATIDRLALKNTGMKAALISTPNKPGDIMDVIRRLPEAECPYKRLYLPYTRGLGKIFSVQEINELKNKIFGFEREYNLRFNIGYQGVFSQEAIEYCISLADNMNLNNYVNINFSGEMHNTIAMGIDWGWGGKDKTAVVIGRARNLELYPPYIPVPETEENPPIVEVIFAQEWERPNYYEMINTIVDLFYGYNCAFVIPDASDPAACRLLCQNLHQSPEYQQEFEILKERGDLNPFEYMSGPVIPTNWNQEGRFMLQHIQRIVNNKRLAVPRSFNHLILALQTAVTKARDLLDKDATKHPDTLDATMLMAKFYFPLDYPIQHAVSKWSAAGIGG